MFLSVIFFLFTIFWPSSFLNFSLPICFFLQFAVRLLQAAGPSNPKHFPTLNNTVFVFVLALQRSWSGCVNSYNTNSLSKIVFPDYFVRVLTVVGNGFGLRKLLCSFWNNGRWAKSTNQVRLNTSLIWILKFTPYHRIYQAVCSVSLVETDISLRSFGSVLRFRRNMLPMAETKKRSPPERNKIRRKSCVLRGHWDRQTAGFWVQVIACVVRCVSYSEQKETSASDG